MTQFQYKNSFKVIVVGSGLAGLSAAAHLVQNGLDDICVLEAKDKIGGRISTIEVNGKPLDLGAQFIHGACPANSVYNLANKLKLCGNEVQRLHEEAGSSIKRWSLTPGYILRPDGIPISEAATEQAYEVFNGIAEEAEYLAKHHDPQQSSRLSTFYNGRKRRALEGLRKAQQCDIIAEVDLALSGLQRALAIEAGHDLNKVKTESFGLNINSRLPGGSVNISQGAGKLIENLAKCLPLYSVKLNHEVQSLDWSLITRDPRLPDKVAIECKVKNGSGKGIIRKTLYADYVICTMSLGYLKKHHETIFVPKLDDKKIQALENMGMGQVCKLLLEWSEPWWAHNEGGIQLAWPSDYNDNILFNGPLGSKNPDYERHWYRSLCNFSEVESHPNILVTWIAGEAAKVVDKLDDEEVLATITDVLKSFTGDPGLVEPQRLLRHRWNSDDYSLGGWAFQTTSISEGEIENLAQPLPSPVDPRLLFAGEATENRFFGNLLGARLSGLREAERILDREEYKRKIVKEVKCVIYNNGDTLQHAKKINQKY